MLFTPISPPIASTSCLQIVSPSPLPPYLPRGGPIGLREAFENRFLPINWNTDTRILDRKIDRCMRGGFIYRFSAHNDLTLRCKLDSIPD